MGQSVTAIRRAGVADAPGIAELMRQYWEFESLGGFDRVAVEKNLIRFLSHPHLGTAWVAQNGAGYAGYLLGVFMLSFEFGGTCVEIDEFYVGPVARGRGLGGSLLRAVEEFASSNGCGGTNLRVAESNVAAQHFYARNGFLRRDGYLLLEKRLQHAV